MKARFTTTYDLVFNKKGLDEKSKIATKELELRLVLETGVGSDSSFSIERFVAPCFDVLDDYAKLL